MSGKRTVAWVIWMIASVFYAYQYILRVMPNIMLQDIMQQFDINAATFGQFSGVYYIGYSLMHLPLGILLDRYGPKKMMTLCILLTVVGMFPLLFAEQWIYPVLGRVLIGMGSSAAILGVFKIIRMTFSEERFPRMLSFSVTIGLIGAIYGGGPVSYLREVMGYHTVIQLSIVAGLILAVATYWIIPNIETTEERGVISDIKEVIGNRKVVLSCIFAGLMVGPLEGFADVWGTVFLKQVYGYEGALAASIPSMMFIGMCFGAPILSWIGDKTGNYVGTVMGSSIVMAVAFFSLLFVHLTPAVLTAVFILIGVCCAYQILAIYKVSTYVREEVAGLTTAVANMIIMLFGYAFHVMIGNTVHLMGGPEESLALRYGVLVIPIALCLGALGYLPILIYDRKETMVADPV